MIVALDSERGASFANLFYSSMHIYTSHGQINPEISRFCWLYGLSLPIVRQDTLKKSILKKVVLGKKEKKSQLTYEDIGKKNELLYDKKQNIAKECDLFSGIFLTN